MGFFAVVFEVQAIVHVMLKGEVVRRELVVDHYDAHGDRVGRGCAKTHSKKAHSKHNHPAQRCNIPNHESHPPGRLPYRRFLVERSF
jgi:hypothetical protein